jgi:hypothetical protein
LFDGFWILSLSLPLLQTQVPRLLLSRRLTIDNVLVEGLLVFLVFFSSVTFFSCNARCGSSSCPVLLVVDSIYYTFVLFSLFCIYRRSRHCGSFGCRGESIRQHYDCSESRSTRADADPVRNEQLMPDDADDNTNNDVAYVSGGALLGGLMGAAGAYMHGTPVSSGVFGGAMSGAVGGVVLQEVLRSPERSPQAVRTVRRRMGPNGSYTITTSTSTGGASSFSRHRNTSNNNGRAGSAAGTRMDVNDPMVEQMLRAMRMHQGSHQQRRNPANNNNNIDTMNYEQLLQAFGDGSENRGADETDIYSLPTQLLTDPTRLSVDHRQCMVCLETFVKGDSRKTLPCLHGFHDHCIDKWLRQNGSCPICKHNIRS